MADKDEFPDYLALERTFLAWIRTGLALMGFGFVVARFGLFLREMQAAPPTTEAHSSGMSVWFGTTLIVIGVAANLIAAWRHRELVQQLDRGEIPRPGSVAANIIVAVILALVGLAMAIYLLTVRGAPAGIRNDRGGTYGGRGNQRNLAEAEPLLGGRNGESAREAIAENGCRALRGRRSQRRSRTAGLKMPNTKLLIFGNPRAGTPHMLASPGIAIDLSLKILVSEDERGGVFLSYNSSDPWRSATGYRRNSFRTLPSSRPSLALPETNGRREQGGSYLSLKILAPLGR